MDVVVLIPTVVAGCTGPRRVLHGNKLPGRKELRLGGDLPRRDCCRSWRGRNLAGGRRHGLSGRRLRRLNRRGRNSGGWSRRCCDDGLLRRRCDWLGHRGSFDLTYGGGGSDRRRVDCSRCGDCVRRRSFRSSNADWRGRRNGLWGHGLKHGLRGKLQGFIESDRALGAAQILEAAGEKTFEALQPRGELVVFVLWPGLGDLRYLRFDGDRFCWS